jgi:hypothetical protein
VQQKEQAYQAELAQGPRPATSSDLHKIWNNDKDKNAFLGMVLFSLLVALFCLLIYYFFSYPQKRLIT